MKSSRRAFVIFTLSTALAAAQAPQSVADAVAQAAANPGGTAPPAATSATAATTATVATTIPQTPVRPPTGAVEQPASTGETSIKLDVGFGIRAVLPSRVTVPVGEILRVIAPDLGSSINYTWTKNGRAIPNTTGNVLMINYVVSSDAGTYACQFSTPTTRPQSSQSLVLGVGPTNRLMNLSTRANIGAGADEGLVSGFAVESGAQPKKLILRAVGPSLAMFGVTTPLRAPMLRIFDSKGEPYTNGYVYPAVVGGPTYETDLAESLGRTGAFPIPSGTRDAVVMMPFLPGNYTAQVTSGDGTAGTVLLEIYEVP